MSRLAQLAARAHARLERVTGAAARVAALNDFLYREEGFAGNRADYYDARNSFLNEVLERRTGIPITLAIVYTWVAARIGLPARGVGFPGHFLVRIAQPDEILVDPFTGELVSRAECEERLRATCGRGRPRARPEPARADPHAPDPRARAAQPEADLARARGVAARARLRRADPPGRPRRAARAARPRAPLRAARVLRRRRGRPAPLPRSWPRTTRARTRCARRSKSSSRTSPRLHYAAAQSRPLNRSRSRFSRLVGRPAPGSRRGGRAGFGSGGGEWSAKSSLRARRREALVRQRRHLEHAQSARGRRAHPVADLHQEVRLHALVVHLHAAADARVRRLRARLVHARRAQPAVDADPLHYAPKSSSKRSNRPRAQTAKLGSSTNTRTPGRSTNTFALGSFAR